MKPIAHLLAAAVLAASAFSSFAAEEAKPAAAAAAAAPAKPDLAKGEASFGAVCVACHGPEGNSVIPANPRLAQQHPEYIIKQLHDFKSGARDSAVMKGFASTLSDDDMRNIAYWLTSRSAKPGAAKDKDTVALGEKIYRGGIQDRQIAACAGCHSPNGAGIPSQFPRLAGQHADYASTQLKAFRDGVRKNNAIMTTESAKLNDREIAAVADYIAGLR